MTPTPSDEAVVRASTLAPSDLCQWDFAVSQQGQLVSCYAKTQSLNPMTPSIIADVVSPIMVSPSETLPPPGAGESPPCKKAKQTTVKILPELNTHGGIIYRPPNQSDTDNDGAPSMAFQKWCELMLLHPVSTSMVPS